MLWLYIWKCSTTMLTDLVLGLILCLALDKKNHTRQVTDTSTFAMFLNDEAFQKIVLGSNYFRINRLQHTFTPPPVCGDSVLSNEAIVGIGVGAGVLVVVALVIAAVLICARSSDETAFIRVGGGSSATTNV